MKIKLKKINRQWNKTKMKQIINSNHKTFNKLTNLIDNHGTMIANTQTCFIVRGYDDILCNGLVFKNGYLQNEDLKHQKNNIKQFLNGQKDSFWLSNFYLKNLFCTFAINQNTHDLFIFDYSKNKKQQDLIKWLVNYLFEIVEG